MTDQTEYHLREFEVARQPGDKRQIYPDVPVECQRWLDVGCGGGATIEARNRSGMLAVGVDPDLSSLQLGRKEGVQAAFICAGGEQLPFASGTFDLVSARVSLPYMNVPVALHEFARVLRPGGRLWLVLHPLSMVDWSHALRRVRLLAYECYRLGNTVALAWGLPLMAWPARVRRYESYQTDGGIRRALARSGFDNIVISRSQHYVVTCAKR